MPGSATVKPPPPLHAPRGWRVVRGLHRTAAALVAGLRAQPRPAVNGWWMGLAALLAGGCAAMLVLCAAAAGAARGGRLAWEADVAEGANRWPLGFGQALILDALGSPLLLVPLVLAAAGAAALAGRPLRALTFLASYFVLSLPVVLGWLAWRRARPTAVLDGLASPGFSAFPSGHVAQAASVYGLLALVWMASTPYRGERVLAAVAAVGATALVAAARLRLGVHWPTDLAAGAVLGFGWALASGWMLRAAERRGGR